MKQQTTNLDKVRSWKKRLFILGFRHKDVANRFNRTEKTVTHWTNPDKYGLPLAHIIDSVEDWLAEEEEKRKAELAAENVQ